MFSRVAPLSRPGRRSRPAPPQKSSGRKSQEGQRRLQLDVRHLPYPTRALTYERRARDRATFCRSVTRPTHSDPKLGPFGAALTRFLIRREPARTLAVSHAIDHQSSGGPTNIVALLTAVDGRAGGALSNRCDYHLVSQLVSPYKLFSISASSV